MKTRITKTGKVARRLRVTRKTAKHGKHSRVQQHDLQIANYAMEKHPELGV